MARNEEKKKIGIIIGAFAFLFVSAFIFIPKTADDNSLEERYKKCINRIDNKDFCHYQIYGY